MGVSAVNPVSGPEFTPPRVEAAASSSANARSATDNQALFFAALLRAQMDSIVASTALSGLNNVGGGGLGGGALGGLSGRIRWPEQWTAWWQRPGRQ